MQKRSEERGYIKPYMSFGFDLGKSSCGFAALDMTGHEIPEIGSRLFDAPENGNHGTNASVRRGYRSSRRNIKRNRDRRGHVLRALKQAGLVPDNADGAWLAFRKGDLPQLEARARGLDNRLTDRELAQVLYVLAKRRGYIPHGEDKSSEDDAGKVLSALAKNDEAMTEGGYRTVGEYLHAIGKSRNASGKYELCVRNGLIADEARKLIAAQRSLGNEKASEEFEAKYIEALEWQHIDPFYDRRVYDDTVGSCTYFPDEKRAARADPSSEMCSAWEKACHVRVVDRDGHARPLPYDERKRIIEVLFSPVPIVRNAECKVRYSDLRKALELSGNDRFRGVPYSEESIREVYVPKAWRRLRRELSKSCPELLIGMREDRGLADRICEALTMASNADTLAQEIEPLGLDNEALQAVLVLPYNSKVFKGYGSRSVKALNMLIDAFDDERTESLAQAEEACGLMRKRNTVGTEKGELLPPYTDFDPMCRNQTVLRAMAQFRKVFNAMVRSCGIPDEVHIELARDLKQSKRQREVIEKRNRQNKKQNDKARKEIAEACGTAQDDVSGEQVLKYRLYIEQGGRDPYLNDGVAAFDLVKVLADPAYAQIDHILPFSRTADNRRSNKVLVKTKSNQDKGQRTPYEWMTSGEKDAPDWDAFRLRVNDDKNLYRAKREHLLNTDLGTAFDRDEFLNRDLNDTRYMSRTARAYVERYIAFRDDGKQHVVVSAGGATALLRREWGLKKDREDDRHHAVDACVIAATTPSMVQRIARASASLNDSAPDVPQPWPGFSAAVTAARAHVVPTRAKNHRVARGAFKDSAFHIADSDDRFDYTTSAKTKYGSNLAVMPAGYAREHNGMAFIRLWLDPTASKGRGKWYVEPVYYADIPAIARGDYVPRVYTRHKKRALWDELPESCDPLRTITVFRGDVLRIDGSAARYSSFGIGSGQFTFTPIRPADSYAEMPSLSKWDKTTRIETINEDVLGHCYRSFR